MPATITQNIDLLSHARSPKRRAAAKRLRKIADPTAGPSLVAALEEELKDDRTWETQYQMIMAIGHCNYTEALPYINSLVLRQIGGMVDIAIGDTILRLSRKHRNDADPAITFIESRHQALTHGAMQAIAMLRMIPEEAVMQRLVNHGLSLQLGDDDWTVIWLLRAAPRWPQDIVNPLLDKWAKVPFQMQQQIHGAVESARKRKSFKWSPL
jgi:hypothetical protein